MLLQQPCGEFEHGDGGPRLDGLDQEALIGHQLAASRWTALPGWCRRAGVPCSPHELDGEAVADVKVARRRPAGMARPNIVCHPHPKIDRIAVTHDPPPVPGSESQIAPAQKARSLISGPML